MAIILSVSIDKQQADYLTETKLSPSALLQRTINELMERHEVSPDYVKHLQNNIQRLQETIQKFGSFVDKRGLMQEYIKEDV
jgi:post-segregation antitoxin (ccd killing protein)